MTCKLCDELSSRFDLSIEKNWTNLTPVYLEALTEHADMDHSGAYPEIVEKYLTLPITEYHAWYVAFINGEVIP